MISRVMWRLKRCGSVIMLSAMTSALVACSGHYHSRDRVGHSLNVSLLTMDKMGDVPHGIGINEEDYRKRVRKIFPQEETEQEIAFPAVVVALAPYAIEFVVSAASKYFAEESEEYSAQYESATYGDRFWQVKWADSDPGAEILQQRLNELVKDLDEESAELTSQESQAAEAAAAAKATAAAEASEAAAEVAEAAKMAAHQAAEAAKAARAAAAYATHAAQEYDIESRPLITQFTQNIFGMDVVRTTSRFSADPSRSPLEPPAMLLRLAFVPSADGSGFLIKPVLFQANSAKAKVSDQDASVDFRFNIAIDAMWVDSQQRSYDTRIAESAFSVSGYDLNSRPVISDFGGQWAGWFPTVPVSVDEHGKRFGQGMIRVSVLVTEQDATKVGGQLLQISDFIRENRQTIIDSATGQLEK